MRKSQLEAIALTGMIEGKRARGRQRKTFMDWLSLAYGEQWKINDILKICQDRNERKILIANVRYNTAITLDWIAPPKEVIRRNFAKIFDTHKTKMIGLPCGEETITIC